MISLSLININYYIDKTDNTSIDWASLIAICISILTIFISVRSIYLAKQEEIRYKKFEDLCLNPVQDELKRIYEFLIYSQTKEIQNCLNQINEDQRSFSLQLARIRRVFKNINVNHLHDLYLDFSDVCFNQPPETQIKSVIENFQLLRVDILDHLYNNALTRKNWFGKSKAY